METKSTMEYVSRFCPGERGLSVRVLKAEATVVSQLWSVSVFVDLREYLLLLVSRAFWTMRLPRPDFLPGE